MKNIYFVSNGRFGNVGKASVVLCIISWQTLEKSLYLWTDVLIGNFDLFRRLFSFAEVPTIDTYSLATMGEGGMYVGLRYFLTISYCCWQLPKRASLIIYSDSWSAVSCNVCMHHFMMQFCQTNK